VERPPRCETIKGVIPLKSKKLGLSYRQNMPAKKQKRKKIIKKDEKKAVKYVM